MKISKVDHVRSGVGTVNQNRIGGILYEDPNKARETININDRLTKLNRKSAILYNIFNPVQAGTEPLEPKEENFAGSMDVYEERKKNYDIKFENFKRRKQYERDIPSINKSLKSILFTRGERNWFLNDLDTIIYNVCCGRKVSDNPEELVDIALRKSLYDAKTEAIIFLNSLGEKELRAEDKKAIELFYNALKADYEKLVNKESRSHYIRSIENQNMVIQLNENQLALPIPSETGKNETYKSREKNGFNEFLLKYADLDADVRIGYLRKLRRILDAYFDAPVDFYKKTLDEKKNYVRTSYASLDASDFNVWERHEQGKKEVGTFVNLPDELKKNDNKKMVIDSIKAIQIKDDLNNSIRHRNMDGYQYTKTLTEEDAQGLFFDNQDINIFWIHHIENAIERILDKRLINNSYKLNIGYLKEKIWKDLINAVSIKYIAVGKAVFNFGMDGVLETEKDVFLGDFGDNSGLNSFDYEILKAGETLQREVSVNIAFAANNLGRAVAQSSDTTDIFKNKLERDTFKSDSELKRGILQYFGGQSKWDDEFFSEAYTDDIYCNFLNDIKNIIYSLRNESFHFKTYKISENWQNKKFIGDMFKKEAEYSLSLERDKFYSNNLPMFYSSQDLEKMLNKLYANVSTRASQVPAFNAVVVRKNLPKFIKEILKYKIPAWTDTDAQYWYSAIYYLLKELYYNSFLQSGTAKQLFLDALEKLDPGNIKNADRAISDFTKRVNGLPYGYSLSEVCQSIMTEYNLQNNQSPKVRSGKANPFDDEIFKHYKLLLIQALKIAFGDFLSKDNDFAFLGKPEKREMPKKEDFLPDWKSEKYCNLIKLVYEKPQLQKWYITCRFLNGRTINSILGSFRSYIAYSKDIKKRAEGTGNRIHKNLIFDLKEIEEIIQVVEICGLLSGAVSNKFTDYFDNEDEYATYLSKFVNFGINGYDISPYSKLLTFCGEMPSVDKIYADEKKPIVNKNIIFAKLYGPDTILENVLPPIEKEAFEQYSSSADKIVKYRNKGNCDTREEQNQLLEYQRLKNRVELRDLVEYGELVNELLGQLINWSYLRERDLLYFQLGFHYMCLKNDSVKPEGYKNIIRSNGTHISNVILQQVMALHVAGIKTYIRNDANYVAKSAGYSVDLKKALFNKYEKSIEMDSDSIYDAGMELLGTKADLIESKWWRNKIDHFNYYSGKTDSLLDYYSEAFDKFFTYDKKYQKNVVNLLENILLRHNVIIEPNFGSCKPEGNEYYPDKKVRAQIGISCAYANEFTYKLNPNEHGQESTVKLDARSKDYIENVIKILYYPHETPKDNIVRTFDRNKKENTTNYSKRNDFKGSNKSKNNPRDNRGDRGERNYSSGNIGTSMGDLLKNIKL